MERAARRWPSLPTSGAVARRRRGPVGLAAIRRMTLTSSRQCRWRPCSTRSMADRRPRSVLTTTDTVGGVWNYTLELATALRSHGVRVAVATMGKPLSESQRTQLRMLPGTSVFESDFKLEWMNEPWSDVDRAGQW